ncbi:MAG TPA: hypothetical protein VGZ73_23085 [Bryobacteraceae bacterium]|nr:hypothetical protein [Bryobacteraceae bacterium]
MEPVVLVFLSTAVGTIVGVGCAALMMQRRNRVSAGDGGKLSPENLASIVAPNVTIDDVRKLLAERDETLQQCRDDLEKRQQQLAAAMAAGESAVALRAEAEQRSNDLATQVNALTAQMKELAAKANEGGQATEESVRQIAALQSQLDSEKVQSRELTEQIAGVSDELAKYKTAGAEAVTQLEAQLDSEKQQGQALADQVARLMSELMGYRVSGSEAVTELAAQLEAEKKQNQELAGQVAILTIDLTQSREYGAAADGYRSSLETELGVGRLRIHELTDQVAELSRELEEELESKKTQGLELTERIAHLSSELTEYRLANADVMDQLEVQLKLEKKQSEELAGQVASLTVDLTHARQYGEESDRYRSSLEAELGVSRSSIAALTDTITGLTDKVAELNLERADFENRLREERESAAKGIELLSLVQSTLSGALHRRQEEQHVNGAAAPAQVSAKLEPVEPVAVSPVVGPILDLALEPAETPAAVSA